MPNEEIIVDEEKTEIGNKLLELEKAIIILKNAYIFKNKQKEYNEIIETLILNLKNLKISDLQCISAKMNEKTYTLIAYKPSFYEREGQEDSDFIELIGLSQDELINELITLLITESNYTYSDNKCPYTKISIFEDADYDFENDIKVIAKAKADEILNKRKEEEKCKKELEKIEREKLEKEKELEELQRLMQKYPTSAKKIIELINTTPA